LWFFLPTAFVPTPAAQAFIAFLVLAVTAGAALVGWGLGRLIQRLLRRG
jgi:hypothetical protein